MDISMKHTECSVLKYFNANMWLIQQIMFWSVIFNQYKIHAGTNVALLK